MQELNLRARWIYLVILFLLLLKKSKDIPLILKKMFIAFLTVMMVHGIGLVVLEIKKIH